MWAIRAPALLARVALWKLPSSVTGHVIWVRAVERLNRDQTALKFLFETLSRLAEALVTPSDTRNVAASAKIWSLLCVRMVLFLSTGRVVGGVGCLSLGVVREERGAAEKTAPRGVEERLY